MTDYKTDDEKVEDLKAWWKENGTSVVAGVALAIAALFGWEYWKDHKAATAAEASALYSKVTEEAEKTPEQVIADVQTLQNDYASTPYAAIASLKAAQQFAEKGEYDQAISTLRWTVDNGKQDEYKYLASIRLARVFLAAGKPEDAHKLTEQTYPAAYQALIEELKGDIYAAQNKPAEARAAYDKAILGNTGGSTEFIKMKRDNLGEG